MSAGRLALLALIPLLTFADSMDDLRQRWAQKLTGGTLDTTISEVRSRISSIQSTGNREWTSMQKTDPRTSLWTDLASATDSAVISSTYARLHDLTLAWATPGQSLYQNSALLADIISGMDWMDTNRYNPNSTEFGNWYDWEIGSPVDIVDIVVLLYAQLTPDQLTRYMAAVNRFDSDPRIMELELARPVTSTGANLTDKCKVALLRGLLVKDQNQVNLAVTSLSPVFAYVTSGDGFYVDGSYVQHSYHPYTGSYGLVLLQDIGDLLWLLAGSPFDVTDPNRANVTAWVNNAFDPLIWEGAMADMVRGRAISRSTSSDHVAGHTIIGALMRIAQFATPDLTVPLNSTIKRWLQDDTSTNYAADLPLDLIGAAKQILNDPTISPSDLPSTSHIYASMDRALHRRPTWAAGIAMHSTRIYNFESINGENLHGWHTADGMIFLYNSDLTQFDAAFWPTVDPQRLPGTTVINGATARESRFGGSNMVGGASIDGYSAVMMELIPDGGQLNAKKSWFLLDSELVALGADITSTSATQNVETIIDNRRLSSDAVFTSDPNGAWASLTTGGASIGYLFPDGSPWQLLNETRTGAWHDINTGGATTQVSGAYQTLWFEHGIMPAGASYSYVLLPGMDSGDTSAYAAAPAVQIVQNDANAQAISHAGLGVQAVNFWNASGVTVAGLTSDSIASVIVHQANGQIDVAVADPTQANKGIIHIGLPMPASSVISQDDAVSVDQLSPNVQISISVNGSHGKSFQVTLQQ